MKKILFIPADNINLKFSRSYNLAAGLAKNNEVYFVSWYDSRNYPAENFFSRIKISLYCLFKSVFRRFSLFYDAEDNFYRVAVPMLTNNGLRQIIGSNNARYLMLHFNAISQKILVKKLSPDIIFYADGFFMFPAYEDQNKKIKLFADMQDDFNAKEITINKVKSWEIRNFSKTVTNFTISKKACENLSTYFQSRFSILPNGANFELIRNIPEESVSELKKKLGIANRYVISFIGTPAKYDPSFAQELAGQMSKKFPEAVLVLIGQLPRLNSSNVINIGPLTYNETSIFFRMSDVGAILTDTSKNDFLNNSFPLKVIQYSAAKKPIVTFPMSFINEINADNIFVAKDIDEWSLTMEKLKNTFEWNNTMEDFWKSYDWDIITQNLSKQFTEA